MENLVLVAAVVLLALAERHPGVRFEPLRIFRPFFGTDAFCFLTGALFLGVALRSLAAERTGILLPASLEPTGLPRFVLFPAAIVLYDLGGYVSHVLLHRFDALWELHKVHHSSRALDWLATFRAHLFEHALRHMLSPVVLLLAGFPIGAVGIAGAVYAASAAFGHSNVGVRLRALEPLFITPRLHRLHHVPATSEKNFGTLFSIWDRLFGTILVDPGARLAPIGVPGEVERYPQRWVPLFLEPLRRIFLGRHTASARAVAPTSRSSY